MDSLGFGMIGFFRTVEANRRLTGLGCGRCGSKASQRAEFAEDVQEHQQISARVVQGRFAHAFANAFNAYSEGRTCWAMLFSAMSRAD
jgi:hypothetical protein